MTLFAYAYVNIIQTPGLITWGENKGANEIDTGKWGGLLNGVSKDSQGEQVTETSDRVSFLLS